jgi:nucleoside-diphosphate-sugar epimerase
MLSGKTFLIIGSTGRLGTATVLRLEELGAKVIPLVLKGYPIKPKRVPWEAKTDPISVDNINDLKRLPIPDYAINFHWCVDRTLSFTEQIFYELGHNIRHIAFLWEWLADKPLQRFINISSIKIFSYLNQNPISADTEPKPVSPYGIAKITAERFLDSYFCNSEFSVNHLRLCSVASFGEHPSQLMTQFCISAFTNCPIRVNAEHISYIIYIDEVIDLIINAALTVSQWRYIIATPSISTEQIARKFEQISGRRLNAEFVDLASGCPDPIFVSDIKKLRAHWVRCTSLELMIDMIISHYTSLGC